MFNYVEKNEDEDIGIKNRIAEWFFTTYSSLQSCDIYRWLWEGEYGRYNKMLDMSLDKLTEDIRLARIHPRQVKKVWEPLGLAMVLVKINLVSYSESGCPLKRLIMLEERARDIRPNPLRFKRDWSLIKTQLLPDMKIKSENLNDFENSIPFHIVPEVAYSTEFVHEYGQGYRIVPRSLFFDYFPEYEFEAEEWSL